MKNNQVIINKILNQGGETPFYVMDEREFEKSVKDFQEALKIRFHNVRIGYSLKTNSLPYVLKLARKLGCFAEVVSSDEYKLAKHCGFLPCEIIYNGPMKSKDTFLECIQEGGTLNIETKRELKWLSELPAGKSYKVGIRLNINISIVSPEDSDGEDDNSRFGFSLESGEFQKAIEYIETIPYVNLVGLHIHRTAHSRSPRFYENSVRYAADIIQKFNLQLDYLDIGGGYFGIFPNKPTFRDYAQSIAIGLGNLKIPNIIIEPGNALVASCFKFITEVIDTKKVDPSTFFVTTDGSRNDVDPFFRKSDYLKEIVYKSSPKDRHIEEKQIVVGCTCLEYDRLFIINDSPQLEVGDKIIYNNVGAYTLTLSPLFIRYFPKVYSMDKEGNLKLVRAAWEAKDYFPKGNND